MTRRPDAAILLLTIGGLFTLYFTSSATDLGLGCPGGATQGCAIYWSLVGLSWAAGVACLALVALLAFRPKWHRVAGVIACAPPATFLVALGLLLHLGQGIGSAVVVVLAIFLWPYLIAILGGILALMWHPRDSPSAPISPPVAWPPPPDGVPRFT
jgi:hypothetical protein